MSKTIIIKLTKASPRVGPFTITDDRGNVLATGVTLQELIDGVVYTVDDAVNVITIQSTGKCKTSRSFSVNVFISPNQITNSTFTISRNACLWRHLTNPEIYNYYYGNIEPYIIEYPFAYQYNDEILQNVKDYTKAYKYFASTTGVWNDNARIETDDRWFNKAVLYNGQQSTGVLELVPKPLNNLSQYLTYPIYNTDSKTITYTKSDNFYQYNTFWSLVKSKSEPLFLTTCESLSIDKIVNQANMDYGKRSFKKEPLRAKELKVRHILDNRSDAHLVSQFIVTPAQVSYK
jgi:hypothetical protein